MRDLNLDATRAAVDVILEMRDDLISRETRYYAEPLDSPERRADWVQCMPED